MAGASVTAVRLGHLRDDDRVAITGASGWLGRSLLHHLSREWGERLPEQVLALGASRRLVRLLDGRQVLVQAWDDEYVASWHPTLVVHLACLTPDRMQPGGEAEFAATNASLSERGLALRALSSVRGFLLASSGAATLVGTEAPLAAHPYALQRRRDEELALRAEAVPSVVARAWSVSGPYCTRPEAFAFSDFVHQALRGGPVRVRARGRVLRRYVDAGEFLALTLNGLAAGRSGLVDSTGPLVEVRDLAAEVARILGATVEAAPESPDVRADLYYSDSPAMAQWAAEQGVTLMDLEEQIRFTARGSGDQT